MNHTEIITLPKTPTLTSQAKGAGATISDVSNDIAAMVTYLQDLQAAIGDMSMNVYKDLSQGRARHEAKTANWAVTDNVDNGEIKFRDDGAVFRLQVKLNGIMYQATLTAV